MRESCNVVFVGKDSSVMFTWRSFIQRPAFPYSVDTRWKFKRYAFRERIQMGQELNCWFTVIREDEKYKPAPGSAAHTDVNQTSNSA